MASLQASSLLLSYSSSSSCSSRRIQAAIHVPKLQKVLSIPELPTIQKFPSLPLEKYVISTTTIGEPPQDSKLYAILEAVADRVEMHTNVGEQRNNWNTLLLNSINMITLTAATSAGIAATSGIGVPLLALKLSSALLFSAATGMLLIMNKIQPSQLAEEQRNASRLFKQLQREIQTSLALGTTTDVKVTMEKVLALDKAYPLPLLGAMLEKFPQEFEPASWWPKFPQVVKKQSMGEQEVKKQSIYENTTDNNGWSEKLEVEMREIVQVLKRKDTEDYMRLGKLALKMNKTLAISGPLLTGIAAIGSAFVGPAPNDSWAVIVAVVAGALASTINTLEHGGQVGMVFEMYRNCAGSFKLLEELIESTLEERDVEKRENGELFEMKVALQLGRSLSQLRDLTARSCRDRSDVDEFASKLF